MGETCMSDENFESILDLDLDSLSLFDGAMALNAAIDPSFDRFWVEAKLTQMVFELEDILIAQQDESQRLEALLRHFYQVWGFSADIETSYLSKNQFIDKVIESRQGIPVSLGTVLLYFCEHFNLPVHGVLFPSQLILRVDCEGQHPYYIDPSNGERLSKHTLTAWLKGYYGPLASLKPEHFETIDPPSILGRWLAIMKFSLLNEKKFDLALNCCDLALSFAPDDPHEIRDRGHIYQMIEYNQMAADDFEYFVEQCPDDPAAKMLHLQALILKHDSVVLH